MTGPAEMMIAQLRERLAAIEHERWSDWQRYVHDMCQRREDGALVIPAELAARWQRQIATDFAQLSEEEKASDRQQVDRYWPEFERVTDELADLRALFDMQYTRMAQATARWRAESPAERAWVMPDLGELLSWLMAQADAPGQMLPEMTGHAPLARARCDDPAHTPTPAVLPCDFWQDTDDHLIEAAWGLIANAWDACAREGRTDWHEAAIAWRERYHGYLRRQRGSSGP